MCRLGYVILGLWVPVLVSIIEVGAVADSGCHDIVETSRAAAVADSANPNRCGDTSDALGLLQRDMRSASRQKFRAKEAKKPQANTTNRSTASDSVSRSEKNGIIALNHGRSVGTAANETARSSRGQLNSNRVTNNHTVHRVAQDRSGESLKPRVAATRVAVLISNTVNSSSGSASVEAVAVATDRSDISWLLAGAVLMAFLYALIGACSELAPVSSRESIAERYAHHLASRWPTPIMQDVERYPALSGKLIGHSADVPLMCPLGPVRQRASSGTAWSVDVLTHSKEVLCAATLAYGATGLPSDIIIKLVCQDLQNSPGQVLATIDSTLSIRDGEGNFFGKLVRDGSDVFGLEVGGVRSRWTVSIIEDRHGKLESLAVTWGSTGNIIASAMKTHAGSPVRRTEYLKFVNSEGVDMILVLLCVIGLVAFEVGPRCPVKDEKTLKHLEEDVVDLARNFMSKFLA